MDSLSCALLVLSLDIFEKQNISKDAVRKALQPTISRAS